MKILFRASLIMGVLLLAIPMLCAQSKMSNETLERIFSTMTDRIDGHLVIGNLFIINGLSPLLQIQKPIESVFTPL